MRNWNEVTVESGCGVPGVVNILSRVDSVMVMSIQCSAYHAKDRHTGQVVSLSVDGRCNVLQNTAVNLVD